LKTHKEYESLGASNVNLKRVVSMIKESRIGKFRVWNIVLENNEHLKVLFKNIPRKCKLAWLWTALSTYNFA